MALTATLDKSGYKPGDKMTLAVVSDKRLQSTTISVAAGGETVKVTTTVQLPVSLTDSTGRVWTAGADDGKTAVYTATA